MTGYDDFSVAVRVQVPRRRFKTLHAQAVANGTDVAQLLRKLVIEVVPEAVEARRLSSAERNEYIRRRNAEGANDAVIAAELGCGQSTVTDRRNRMGLPPVRKHTREEAAS